MKDLTIHNTHRRLAEVTFLNLDRNGKMIIDEVTLRVLEPFLLQNLEIVRTLDELSNLSMVAYTAGKRSYDEIRRRIRGGEGLEAIARSFKKT
ncbi:DUF7667 family protein [Paenibacillus glucanolyticus]|uniref:DUF7667 family protein n=1 Tax=Paenibacillus glucanolyticus TaxID=59843 RepID=UPI003F82A5CC